MRLEEVYLHKHRRQTTPLIVEAATLQLDERLHEVCMLKRQAKNEVEREQTRKITRESTVPSKNVTTYIGFLQQISLKQTTHSHVRKAKFCGNKIDFRKEVEVNQQLLSLDQICF